MIGAVDWTFAAILFVVLIVSLTAHEAAHALVAKLGGDDTAYRSGQVTLNPVPHMQREPFGMVLLPLITIISSGGGMCMGFASAPVDAIWAHHHPKRAALVSAAGPVANVLLAAIAFAILWVIGRPESDTGDAMRKIAGVFLLLNVLLALFNLFPVPPLDGAGVVSGLSRPARVLIDNLQRMPYVPLALVIGVMLVMREVFPPVFHEVNGWLPYPWRH